MIQSRIISKVVLRGQDGKILLLRRSDTDVRRPLQWDLPGGMVDNDEDFTTAAVRETLEEAGIVVDYSDLHLAYTSSGMTERGNVCWLIYIGETSQTDVKLSHEHIESAWATPDEALEMVTYERQSKALKHIFDNKLFD